VAALRRAPFVAATKATTNRTAKSADLKGGRYEGKTERPVLAKSARDGRYEGNGEERFFGRKGRDLRMTT
jgi:hypothetical protein